MVKNKKKQYESGHIGQYVSAICDQYKLDSAEVKAFLFHNFKELSDKSHCANCTAGMKTFWHAISSGLVGDLIKAIEFVRNNNKNSFHLAKDLNLTKTEYNNFQKLRFHGLITQVKDKAGYWLITTRGGQFLRGEISIPKSVRTFRNVVQEHSVELANIKDFRHTYPRFETEFAFEYQPQGELL